MAKTSIIESERGNWIYRSSNEFFLFNKTIEQKTFSAFECHGPRWVLGLVKRLSGEVRYQTNQFQETVLNQPIWAFFYPKFSVAFAELLDADLKVNVISSRIMAPPKYVKPVVFHPNTRVEFPGTVDEVFSYLQHGTSFQEVPYCDNPSRISATAKYYIDSLFNDPEFSMQELSTRVGVSTSQISRSFKKDFGVTSIKYRNHLRVMSSLDAILQGVPISTTALEVGFNDISRFNKNFKVTQLVPPSNYSPDQKNH